MLSLDYSPGDRPRLIEAEFDQGFWVRLGAALAPL